jgi:hypothetical protein
MTVQVIGANALSLSDLLLCGVACAGGLAAGADPRFE